MFKFYSQQQVDLWASANLVDRTECCVLRRAESKFDLIFKVQRTGIWVDQYYHGLRESN